MSDSSNKQPISNKVVEVLVDSIFRKHGVKPDEVKKTISDEQKKMIKEMVEDLKVQVEKYSQKSKKEDSE